MRTSELQELLNKQMGFIPKAELMCKVLGLSVRQSWYQRVARDSEISTEEIEKIERHFAVSLRENVNTDCINLDFYPNVFGSCGVGSIVFDESKEKISVAKDMITNYSQSNKYSVISARGSSMTPVINDSDKLIIQQWNGEQIIDDSVYLFNYNGELFIKRLVKNIDQIICISENPRFEDRIIKDLKNFSIIGKVVGLFREKV